LVAADARPITATNAMVASAASSTTAVRMAVRTFGPSLSLMSIPPRDRARV
jgi:hypothetical protein